MTGLVSGCHRALRSVYRTPGRTWRVAGSHAGTGDTACCTLPEIGARNGRTGGASLVWGTGGGKDREPRVKYLLKIDLLCFDGQPGGELPPKGGPHDQAQRREGSAAVSDAGAVSPAGVGVRARARAGRRWPPLRTQCADGPAVAEA